MGRCETPNCFAATICTCTLLLSCSCDPPGKPKREPLPEQVANFRTLYAKNCAGCHGDDGKNGPGRILNDPLYLAVLPKQVLSDIIENGRPGTAMPAWAKNQGGPLESGQIDVLVNGTYSNWAKPVDLHGSSLPAYSADIHTGDTGQGRKLFAMNCFMCHGRAEIGPVTDPAYLSLVSDQMLRTSIIVGRPDFGMPDFRHLKLGHALTDQDIADLVAFLASNRPANASTAANEVAARSQGGVK
jgi:mono/diheme cytochrome c family protein